MAKCNSCSNDAAPDRKSCEYHLERARVNQRASVARRTTCLRCKEPPLPGKRRCATCLERYNAYQSEWSKKNPEKVAEARRRWNRKNLRSYRLVWRYGISEEDYQLLLADQGGVCAICGEPETVRQANGDDVKPLAVDHCHTTEVVRGLLCNGCNTGLGLFKDDPSILMAAVTYLQAFEDEEE